MQYSNESYIRINKIRKLKSNWIIVYANSFNNKQNISSLKNEQNEINTSDKLLIEWAKWNYKISWRITSFRSHWKITFWRLIDSTDNIQIAFSKWKTLFDTWKDKLEEIFIDDKKIDSYKFLEKYIDIWDYIWVTWDLFYTNHWELTLFVKEYKILSKSIRPLPDKFHWVKDIDTIYKQRYLDLITNNQSYEKFIFKSRFIKTLRDFYHLEWFIEINTPILWNSASWAAARPFITYHNDFKQDMFLRIAPEVALKKATVWRFEKVFEFATNFRNEWSDPSHMQEFNVVEHYAVWWNYLDNMEFTEKMFNYIFDKLWINRKINIKDKEWIIKTVDFSTPWEKIDYIEWINKVCWIDVSIYKEWQEKKLINDIKNKWITFENMEIMWVPTLIDYLYKKVLRPSIIWPAFVYNYPKIMQPLARQSDKNSNIVEQFQLVVNWWEINKAYSELVDPEIQVKNFISQKNAINKWDQDATQWDYDFVLAMEYWMPPQSWFWMWIERILTILLEQDNLRDVFLFPSSKYDNNLNSNEFEKFYSQEHNTNDTIITVKNIDDTNKVEISFNMYEELIKQTLINYFNKVKHSYSITTTSLICEKNIFDWKNKIEVNHIIKKINKKLEKINVWLKTYKDEINFNNIKELLKNFAELLTNEKEKIRNILTKYETNHVFDDEFSRTIDILINIEENKDYFKYKVDQIATFLPKNQPLYAFTCFCIIPSVMCKKLIIRKPKSMKWFFDELISILKINTFFPNIEVVSKSRSEYMEIITEKELINWEYYPKTDAVIFTWNSDHSEELKKHFNIKTLFITNWSWHNPIIIEKDADIDRAINAVCELQLYNQWQDCAAPNTIFVNENIYEEFMKILWNEISKKKIWDYISADLWPITEVWMINSINNILIENFEYLNTSIPNSWIIDYKNKYVYPTIIEKPLSEWWNYKELYAPIFFIQKYKNDEELKNYFETQHYKNNAMYLTLYWKNKYIFWLVDKNIEWLWILHKEDTFLHNKHLHMKWIERGTQPYWWYWIYSSNYTFMWKTTSKPTLPQRDIYENLIWNNLNTILTSLIDKIISNKE